MQPDVITTPARGAKSRTKCLLDFCYMIRRKYGSLDLLSTEDLATKYRRFFKLPLILCEADIIKHCHQIGVNKFIRLPLPSAITAYNQDYEGDIRLYVNSSQWPGMHGLATFHEAYEILERRFAAIYKEFKPLKGAALESKANKFGSCIMLPTEDSINVPRLIASIPELIPFLGESALEIIYRRVILLMGGHFPHLFLKFKKCFKPDANGELIVTNARINCPRNFMPLKPRKILLSLLPKPGNYCRSGFILSKTLEFQGPVILRRDKGFDIFGIHDLSLICVPVIIDGEIEELFIFGIKSSDSPNLLMAFRNLRPKVLECEFQVL